MPEERASAMAKIGAVFGLAFIVGPGLGGILTGTDSEQPQFLLPCLVAAGLSFTACLFGLVLLREPRKHQERAATVPLSEALVTMRRPDVLILVALMATVSLVFSQTISIYPLWLESHFNWGPREVGYVFTYIGLVVAIIQGGLIGSMIRRFGEWRVLTLGATAFIAGLAMGVAFCSTCTLEFECDLVTDFRSCCNCWADSRRPPRALRLIGYTCSSIANLAQHPHSLRYERPILKNESTKRPSRQRQAGHISHCNTRAKSAKGQVGIKGRFTRTPAGGELALEVKNAE